MNAILEVPSIRDRVSRVTVEEYHLQPERNANGRRMELIRGIVVEKCRKLPPRHDCVALVSTNPADTSAGMCARKEEPLTLHDSERSRRTVLAGNLGDYLQAHPSTALLPLKLRSPLTKKTAKGVSLRRGGSGGVLDHPPK